MSWSSNVKPESWKLNLICFTLALSWYSADVGNKKPQCCIPCMAAWLGVTDCACLTLKQVTSLQVKHVQDNCKSRLIAGKIINSPNARVTTVKRSICEAEWSLESWLLWYRAKVREGGACKTWNHHLTGPREFAFLEWVSKFALKEPPPQNLRKPPVTCFSSSVCLILCLKIQQIPWV